MKKNLLMIAGIVLLLSVLAVLYYFPGAGVSLGAKTSNSPPTTPEAKTDSSPSTTEALFETVRNAVNQQLSS